MTIEKLYVNNVEVDKIGICDFFVLKNKIYFTLWGEETYLFYVIKFSYFCKTSEKPIVYEYLHTKL